MEIHLYQTIIDLSAAEFAVLVSGCISDSDDINGTLLSSISGLISDALGCALYQQLIQDMIMDVIITIICGVNEFFWAALSAITRKIGCNDINS